MNCNSLAKHYGKLTPRERVPAIISAQLRGDQAERDRLTNSAPRRPFYVADYYFFLDALSDLALSCRLSMLETASSMEMVSGLLESDGASRQPGEKAPPWIGRANRCLRMDAYLLIAYADAWGRFCAELKLAGWRLFCHEETFDPELCWAILPGFATLKLADQRSATTAFDQEGVARFLARDGLPKDNSLTAEVMAADLRRCFQARAEWWG